MIEYPFGNPEGARADLDEITQGFIEFENPLIWKGLATKPSDLRARIFVGKKGSGKTLYLRRARDFAINNSDVFAGEYETKLPPTSEILRFSMYFIKYELRESWTLLWEKAILLSVASYLVTESRINGSINDKNLNSLKTNYEDIFYIDKHQNRPSGVYAELNNILINHNSSHDFNNYLLNPLWNQFESEIADALTQCRPICLYLDGIDENFQHAPMYWLECEIGLFNAVMELLRNVKFGNRLHVFVTLRDLVLLKILQGEHALRNFEEPHIRNLTWNIQSITSFFNEKIIRLPTDSFPPGFKDKSIYSWLGISKIANNYSEKGSEQIMQFLLRHTRLLPRDIVTLGNLLVQELARLKWFSTSEGPEEAIINAVRYGARRIGTEQLMLCASQIASDYPSSIKKNQNVTPFYGSDEYRKALVEDLKIYIKGFRKNRFSKDILFKQDEIGHKIFGEDVDVLSVLWLNGLIGYTDKLSKNGHVVFYSDEIGTEFKLPKNQDLYAFHSCLLDTIGLTIKGEPVLQRS